MNSLLNQVLARGNLIEAYQKVVNNKGSHGVDGVKKTEQLADYLNQHWNRIKSEIETGRYFPNKVRGIEIPKPSGGKRLLGIPTVIDRVIQQAIHQVLSAIFDPDFSTFSYGFRAEKSAHQALRQARFYINQGRQDIIDLDLKKKVSSIW